MNALSTLAFKQLVIPQMRPQQSGTIVNVGSVGGKVSLSWAVMYCAAKWALHCIDDSLHRGLMGARIGVMKVCPWIVDAKFRDHVLAGTGPGRIEHIRRIVRPDQVPSPIIRGLERRKHTVVDPKIGLIFTSLDLFVPWLMDWYVRGKF
jgi:short-subunit dehydrogenase